MRIAVIGAGSTYTPELADGLGRLGAQLSVDELVLMDPDTERLAVVAGLCRRILAHHGSTATVLETDSVPAAAEGASAVLLQIRVGGQAARNRDETWPLRCGCVGQETTGAGGLAKALRTVPVITGIADQVRAVSPQAWIVNFTNPVGIVTRALLEEGHRTIGLCNVAIGLQRYLAGLLEVAPAEVELTHVGLNHLSWELDVTVAGSAGSVWPELLSRFGVQLAEHVELPVDLLTRQNSLPSYYLRYYYLHDQVVRAARGAPTRADEVIELERRLLTMYADPSLDTKPALLGERGGAYYSEAAVGLVAALLGQTADDRHVVNVRNAGALPFLPDDAVIEAAARIGVEGARTLPMPSVPPMQAGLIGHVAAYEQLALDAARHGGRDRVVAALLAHPLVGQLDRAEDLADLLLAENRDWLPWLTS
ncbi:MAG TPA: 6-phospho-beta-glucosidase [Candidatus Nanopelagicales bacterium]|nr:6-phospho-beta-glucosidase [Candidatus Nanopelagicales bacterium]